ncbi:hypothetical protein MTO96_017783 [Rhipicephalus appendiculatus]
MGSSSLAKDHRAHDIARDTMVGRTARVQRRTIDAANSAAYLISPSIAQPAREEVFERRNGKARASVQQRAAPDDAKGAAKGPRWQQSRAATALSRGAPRDRPSTTMQQSSRDHWRDAKRRDGEIASACGSRTRFYVRNRPRARWRQET